MMTKPTRTTASGGTLLLDQRVLVLAPFGRDANEICRVLSDAGLDAARCENGEVLCREIGNGAAAALLAEEAIDEKTRGRLVQTLAEQPAWSDFPLLLMTRLRRSKHDSWQVVQSLDGTGHLNLLDRPLHINTLISAVRTATHARQRQYQVRDTLAARARAEEALRLQEKELRELNRTLEQRVDERTNALKQRNYELQQFAYVASHDMQEPLRKIQTFADLTKTDFAEQLGEEGRFYLDRLQNAAARMSQILHDLLAFSRVATHQQPLTWTSVGAVAYIVLSDLELAIEKAGATVEVDADVPIQADMSQLRQLLNHLVMNALKFRRDGVPLIVRVTAESIGDETPFCRIVVEDNGIGFNEKYVERIFQPFERLHGKAAYPGTGMGLAICRRIAERHHGTIRAESTPGAGSRFIIEFPVRQKAPDQRLDD